MSTEAKEVKETETKETTTTVTKKQTWWNRIWSAIVGAILAVGAMFGITTDQIAEEKAKVETVQAQAKEALDAIKAGDLTTAQAKLTEATTIVKDVVKDAKETVKNVTEAAKEADKKEVGKTAIKGALEGAIKGDIKKVEAATKMYSDDTTKK